MKVINVNPGCTAFVEGRTFLLALRSEMAVECIATAFPEDFLESWNFTASGLEEGLETFETVDLRALQEGAKRLQQFKPWSVQGHGVAAAE